MSDIHGTVLIVDDNLDLQEITAEWLEWRGHKVVRASNGREALQRLATHPIDLMLLDISMPIMDGYQVLQRLQESGDKNDVPVVVMSAIADMDSIVKCIELGAADYLTKPIKMPLFWARVNTLLENKLARDVERQLLRELRQLQKIDKVLNSSLNKHTVAQSILEASINTTNAIAGVIFGQTNQNIRYHICNGDTESHEAMDVAAHLLPELPAKFELSSGPIESGPRLSPITAHRVILPFYEHEQRRYYLILEKLEPFAEKSLSLLARITAHASLAFQNAQLFSELEAGNKAKQHLISYVAHELNTPLTALTTYNQLISQTLDGAKTPRLERYLSVMENATHRMTKMVAELTDIGRIESGKMAFKFDSHAVLPLLDEVVGMQQASFAARGHLFSMTVPDVLPTFWGDRDRLTQILTNLLSNASKYTPEDGQISLDVKPIEEDQKIFLQFAVQDNGIGIREEDRERIFKQFVRAKDERISDVKGLGLGLSITRIMIVKMGGRIWLESEVGRGSTFYFTIPANVKAEAYIHHTSALSPMQTNEL